MEIDNLLSPSKDSFTTLLEDTALPVTLIRSSSGKSLGEHKVKGASAPLEKEDISVSYETRPKGGFSVFYTVPKEPVEAAKMDKLKRLLEEANHQESYSDYEGDYYEEGEYEGNEIASYEVEEYYDDAEELLTERPDIADDYYDPGPLIATTMMQLTTTTTTRTTTTTMLPRIGCLWNLRLLLLLLFFLPPSRN